MRLQKYLSQCGVASRRQSEELITQGRVEVNSKIVTTLGTKIDPIKDKIKVDGERVKPARTGAFIFHKPRKVVSTMSDPEGRPTVADYLPEGFESYFPVGRLDWDSTGLMIFTNDGEMAERLLHPRYECPRTYQVKVEGRVDRDTIKQIKEGIELEDGPISGRAKFVSEEGGHTWLRIKLTEGRNRIIRRLMDHLGHPVLKLRRTKYGPFELGKLRSGQMEKLSKADFRRVRSAIMGSN